ncbi:phosphoglycerate dehydrogenase [Pseudomonas sp. 21TX0197]|uniref:phosphoglycerate dehydrogenase n=1 Tax=unclassified Pseudomonas TaxID=196821 RepID=UPI000908CEAC|nr:MULTISPECIES: phosphoglycerate dehydrogenase [unclassified Pseudomonas]MDB6443731.1 phosphoglycerate dehydrogenase [Pseudomonas sp. 21TX0197]SFW66982.1 D-3-phosphoglycerate dehydrogenase [Pseudomonas sp. NFACC09-4]
MKPRHRVVITQRFFDPAAIAFLQANDCEVVIAEPAHGQTEGHWNERQLIELLNEADGWIVGHANVTADLLASLPRLKVIARRGVGYERVDTAAVVATGKVATIAPGGNDASVADHTVGLMLAVCRRLKQCQASLAGGDWTIPLGSDLYGKTVGVVGLGRIGRAVVQRLSGFDVTTLIHTPHPDEALKSSGQGCRFVDLQTLLKQSDFITLHAPLTPQTQGMIDSQALASMKRSAVLINAARGGLVRDADLLLALQQDLIAGAGLDVFESESDPALAAVSEQLIQLANVVATPHVAASTVEGLNRTNLIAARCAMAVLQGGNPPGHCVIADGRQATVPRGTP